MKSKATRGHDGGNQPAGSRHGHGGTLKSRAVLRTSIYDLVYVKTFRTHLTAARADREHVPCEEQKLQQCARHPNTIHTKMENPISIHLRRTHTAYVQVI